MKQESKQDIILRLTEGLNAQQQSVPQLPADAQARKIKVLGAKTDPKHPFDGYMVGADESAESGKKNIGPDKNDPYEKGWRAGFRHNESNPYPAGSKQAAQWDRGYAEAEAQPNHYDESLAEVDFNPGRRGFLKKAGAVAATAAMPRGLAGAAVNAIAPAASWESTLSAPLTGLTAIDLDDIVNLLMSSKPESMISGKEPYDLDIMKSIAQDAARESWGNPWMQGKAAQAFLDAVELGKKKHADDEDIIQDIFIVAKKQYMKELQQLSPEEVAKVKSQSLNPASKSEPAASPTSGMSGLVRAAGAQLGRTMKNIGRDTANTVLNQPAKSAALPAPSVSPSMQIPKQKSRVDASPFNDDHSELDQFVKEEFNRHPDDINEESGAVVAHGYAYNRQDQRVAWTREFASEAEATEWARRRNATVLSIVPKDSIEEGWKSKLAGAALAGAAAFGGGGAQANDQIAKDTQGIGQAFRSGQMAPKQYAPGEISLSQIHSHPKWLETVQAMIKKYPKNHEDDQRAQTAAREAIKQMIQQGNVREGADTAGGNNPAAAWPDFGTAKTYESQLAEAKQRLAEAESRYVLYFNGKPASHYATEAEAKRIADSIKAKHPTVKIEIKNEMHEGDLNEVTGDLPFDTMLSKIVAGGNLQTLAAKIVAKIKKFPQHVESDGYERDMPRYPDGHFYGADVLNDTFDEVMQQWKKMGPDNFSDEYGEESLFDVLDGSADYTRYWDGILKLRDRLQSMPGALEQLGKMVWHGLFSGSVEKGITDIGRKGVAEGARVDRMVKHIASSEKAAGKSKKDAENIAWATVNKRGMLDNKNKKKHVAEAGTPADIRAKNRAVVKKIQGKEADIDEGWKSKLAGAALAGAAALGGGAQAQTTDKYDTSWGQSGYDTHIKSDRTLTKTMGSDPSKDSHDFQKRIQSVTGPNAKGEYKVVVIQGNDIVSHYVTKTPPKSWMFKEDITQEDIITKLKAKLGDYLSDLGQQIKKDPALQDKLSAETPGDQVGPAVKTVTTDDGQTISIHGNEDDGFRISIKNKHTPSKFDSLDEAVMACEMYRAHRRKQALNADYVEEA